MTHLFQADPLPVGPAHRIVRGVHGADELGEEAHALADDQRGSRLLVLGLDQREAVVHVALQTQLGLLFFDLSQMKRQI